MTREKAKQISQRIRGIETRLGECARRTDYIHKIVSNELRQIITELNCIDGDVCDYAYGKVE